MNVTKFVIQDEQGRFLWGITHRSGVHFDEDTMPQFWQMNEKTKLFSSEIAASEFAKQHDIKSWTTFKIVPVTVTVTC